MASAPSVAQEDVPGNAVEPGGKFRLLAKLGEAKPGAKKRFLSQVVGEKRVAADKTSKHRTDTALMSSHERGEGVPVVLGTDASNEGEIRKHRNVKECRSAMARVSAPRGWTHHFSIQVSMPPVWRCPKRAE